MNTPYLPEGEDLRSLVESSLRLARKIGNAEAERQLLLAMQSLASRNRVGDDDREASSCSTAVVRTVAED